MVHYTLYPVTDYIGIGITECTVDRSELGPRDKILTDVPDVAEDYVNLLGVKAANGRGNSSGGAEG